MIQRRNVLKYASGLALLGPTALWASDTSPVAATAMAPSVESLPKLEGKLRIYLGQGGGVGRGSCREREVWWGVV